MLPSTVSSNKIFKHRIGTFQIHVFYLGNELLLFCVLST